MKVMLRSMWPSVMNIRMSPRSLQSLVSSPLTTSRLSANGLPASSGTNTLDFMCFFLFWLISLPAIWFPIHTVYVFPILSCETLSLVLIPRFNCCFVSLLECPADFVRC